MVSSTEAQRVHTTVLLPDDEALPFQAVDTEKAPLLVYDGDCSFCSSTARWITARWNGPQQAVAWQHLSVDELERLGLTLDDVRRAAWWIDSSHGDSCGHLAISGALQAADGWPSV